MKKSVKDFLAASGIVAAATLGAGIFSLPYVFLKSGWLAGFLYLALLSAAIIFAHRLHFAVLEKESGSGHLLGLTKKLWGKGAFTLAVFAILGGLILGLTGQLVLGARFITILVPGFSGYAMAIFWFAATFPLIFPPKRLLEIEIWGAAGVAVVALLIFFLAPAPFKIFSGAPLVSSNIFLPFGPILFALAGWTAVQPLYEARRKKYENFSPKKVLIFGTLAVVLLYAAFVLGVFGTAGSVSVDSVSGLSGTPQTLVALLGLLSLLGTYRLIAVEVKNSITSDMRQPQWFGFFIAVLGPVLLVFAGLNNFLTIVGLAGGVFIATEYLLIILNAKKILNLGGSRKVLANLAIAVFLLGAIYELYYFFRP